MTRPGNNAGTIVRPLGRPAGAFAVVPDALLRDLMLSVSARLVLTYLVSRPTGWVARVTDIQASLGISATTWRRIRDELRSASIIPADHPKRMVGRKNEFTWLLTVDVTKYYLSTGPSSVLADAVHPPFSSDGKRRVNKNSSPLQKTPPQACATVWGNGEEDRGDPANQAAFHQKAIEMAHHAGLSISQSFKVSRELQKASGEQLAIFEQLLKNPGPGVKDLAAWTVELARRAARGDLTPRRSAAAPQEVKVWKPESFQPASPKVKAEGLAALAALKKGYLEHTHRGH